MHIKFDVIIINVCVCVYVYATVFVQIDFLFVFFSCLLPISVNSSIEKNPQLHLHVAIVKRIMTNKFGLRT